MGQSEATTLAIKVANNSRNIHVCSKQQGVPKKNMHNFK
jgi:hypothetical protein